MSGVHAVEGGGGNEVLNHSNVSDGDTETYKDNSSGDVFGISSEWADEQGNVKPSPAHSQGDTHGGHLGQQGSEFGQNLNLNELAESAKAMGMSEQDISNFVDEFTSNDNNFNPGQTPDQKKVGAAVALNEMIAAENINHSGLGEEEVRKVSADAMKAAKAGDGEELRKVLEDAGGNTGDMTDEQLLSTWNTNGHDNNHAILNVDEGPFKLTHMRSIAKDDAPEGAGLGYSNDKQEFPERGDAYNKANAALETYSPFA